MLPPTRGLATVAAAIAAAATLAMAQAAPVIPHVTDPTRPGQLFNVVGADWDGGAQVRVACLEDGIPGWPEDVAADFATEEPRLA